MAIFKFCFWFFVSDFTILTWIGQQLVKDVWVFAGQIATLYYYVFFLILLPYVGVIESILIRYTVDQAVMSRYHDRKSNRQNFFVY